MKTTTLPTLFLLLVAGCAASGANDPEREQKEQQRIADLDQAQKKLAEGDPDAALLITDQLLKANRDDREARLLAVRGNQLLLDLRPEHTEAWLSDIKGNLERALELKHDDPESWLQLSRTRLMLGDFAAGRDAALTAAEQWRAKKASQSRISEAVLAAADNEMQMFVARRRPEINAGEKPSADTLVAAEAVLARARFAALGAPGAAAVRSANVYQWLERNTQALDELERGLVSDPGHAPAHEQFLTLYYGQGRTAECIAAYRRIQREANTPEVQWYLARAMDQHAYALRAKNSYADAAAAYAAAGNAFGVYRTMAPNDRANANHWVAVCTLARARMVLEQGDIAGAKKLYFEAYDHDPRVADVHEDGTPVIVDAFGGNYPAGLFRVGSAILARSDETGLADSLAFFEEVLAKHPDRFGAFYNNAGLSARDLGNKLENSIRRAQMDEAERKKTLAEAMALYEKSYAYYEKAARLEPEDQRILNDTGLMLIYHLNRDFDRARELFERAIAVGQPKIDALPADAPNDDPGLHEAVGDAYQNLGLLMAKQGRPFEEYEAHLQKAVTYYPFQRREAARMLRAKGQVQGAIDGIQPAPADAKGRNERGGPNAGDFEPALPDRESVEDQASYQGSMGSGPMASVVIISRARQSGQVPVRRMAGARVSWQDPADERKQLFAKVGLQAEEKAAAGDHEGALSILDGVARTLRGYAPFHFAYGRYAFAFAEKEKAAGGNIQTIDGLYTDAVSNLKRAVDLDGAPVPPRVALAKAYFARGDLADAMSTADALLAQVTATGNADKEKEQVAEAHKVRAASAGARYIQLASEKAEAGDKTPVDEKLLTVARESIQALDKGDRLDQETLRRYVILEQWARAPEKAVTFIRNVLSRNPESTELLTLLVDTGYGAAARPAVEALESRTDALGIWYRARARYSHAYHLWTGNPSKADAQVAEMDAAIADFEQAKTLQPNFGGSCDDWIAMCLGSKGAFHYSSENYPEAEKALIASAQLRPGSITTDLGGNNVKLTFLKLVDHFYSGKGDLGTAVRLLKEFTKHASADADLLNNLGLFARDHGNVVEGTGKRAEAMDLYETSYAAYTAASRLEPDSIRLVNDRALILIYHLRRELDDARRWLEQSGAQGEQRLATSPPSDREERNQLEEATGDCYQNLGYYWMTRVPQDQLTDEDLVQARKNLEKSNKFHPGPARRASTGMLRRLAAIEAARKKPEDGK